MAIKSKMVESKRLYDFLKSDLKISKKACLLKSDLIEMIENGFFDPQKKETKTA